MMLRIVHLHRPTITHTLVCETRSVTSGSQRQQMEGLVEHKERATLARRFARSANERATDRVAQAVI